MCGKLTRKCLRSIRLSKVSRKADARASTECGNLGRNSLCARGIPPGHIGFHAAPNQAFRDHPPYAACSPCDQCGLAPDVE